MDTPQPRFFFNERRGDELLRKATQLKVTIWRTGDGELQCDVDIGSTLDLKEPSDSLLLAAVIREFHRPRPGRKDDESCS